MTNKNNWQLTGDYLYGLYYDFELSGTLAEKQQTYLQLLKNVLTVWRLLNIEFASMKGLSGDDNKVRAWVSDFRVGGGKASKAKEWVITEAVYDLHFGNNTPPTIYNLRELEEHFPTATRNPASLDLDSGAQGRFENGELAINMTSFDIEGNGKDYVKMQNKGALVGSHLTFELTPAGSPPITGTVTEIEKIPSSPHFVYTVQSSQPLTSSLIGSLLVLTDPDTTIRGDTLGPVISVDPVNHTLTTAKFRKFVKLRDDDRTGVNLLLPYFFKTNDFAAMKSELYIYKEAYLEIKPVYSDSLIPFKSHIFSGISFGAWVHLPSTYKKVENTAEGGDGIGVWQCLVCAAWQSGEFRERDNDPNSPQASANFGLTAGVSDNNYLQQGDTLLNNYVLIGGNVSVIPLEQMIDKEGNLNKAKLSLPHELGHQFGLQHPKPPEPGNLMNESIDNATTNVSLSKLHRNYIRCRKTSPGIKP